VSGLTTLAVAMKKFVSLSLCLSLSVFTVARAMKPSHTLVTVAKAADEKPTEAEEEEVAAGEDTDQEVASDDDSMENASDDEGKDMNDDDSGNNQDDGDNGGDDDGADDDGGVGSGDDGGD
jgi:hypothetical protein